MKFLPRALALFLRTLALAGSIACLWLFTPLLGVPALLAGRLLCDLAGHVAATSAGAPRGK